MRLQRAGSLPALPLGAALTILFVLIIGACGSSEPSAPTRSSPVSEPAIAISEPDPRGRRCPAMV